MSWHREVRGSGALGTGAAAAALRPLPCGLRRGGALRGGLQWQAAPPSPGPRSEGTMAAVQRPDPGIPGCRRLLCAHSGQRAGGRGHVRRPLLAGAAGTNQPSPLALAVCCSPHKVSHSLPLPAALARDGAPPTGRKVGVQSSSKSCQGAQHMEARTLVPHCPRPRGRKQLPGVRRSGREARSPQPGLGPPAQVPGLPGLSLLLVVWFPLHRL